MASRPFVERPPVAGGLDVDLPGSGVRLRATRWAGEGVPVLLLHGLASSRRFWDLVVPHLSGHPVLALDQRGHGDSERPAGPYDGATVVADALTALDAVGLSRVVVVGHSWGASTALRLAATAPDRVLAVVAVDGGLGSPRSAGRTRAEARTALEPPRTALPPDQLLARVGNGNPASPGWTATKAAALERAGAVLAQPRLQRWAGAVHDVPLQWPALVAGLVRAAADEVSTPAGRAGATA